MQIELKLYHQDLKDECKDTHLHNINTQCFKPEVVQWIKKVGGATYYSSSGGYHHFSYGARKQKKILTKVRK